MAKKKIEINIDSYGIYTKWERGSKALPKIRKFTKEVPAVLDIEFGYILEIKKGKGKKIEFCIDHPQVPDDEGNIRPPFDGVEYVGSNDYRFFIGDTIWAPVENKVGPWRITTHVDGKLVADITFELKLPSSPEEIPEWLS